MSVCFFVSNEHCSEQGGVASVTEETGDGEGSMEEVPGETSQQCLQQFWSQVMEDVRKITPDDFKTQALPLARIKKIMKLDEEVKMISAEAPVLFAKAAEIFIHELTLRAWSHTEDNKRRTLQKNDIAMAISKSDQFDFLIDIVPRHETMVTKPRKDPPRPPPSNETVQVSQHQQPAAASLQQSTSSQPQIVLQPYTQFVQQSATAAPTASTSAQQPLLVQQVVTSSGELPPLQLTQAQVNLIRLQMQNNPNQPIIIQAQPSQGQQLIQVSSQAQQPQQQVYLQVSTAQDDS